MNNFRQQVLSISFVMLATTALFIVVFATPQSTISSPIYRQPATYKNSFFAVILAGSHRPARGKRAKKVKKAAIAIDYHLPPIRNGMVPVISYITTKQPVVFLTIDDGIFAVPSDARVMKAHHVVASFFLVHRFIVDNPNFFKDLSRTTGSVIENHSFDHYVLTNLTYSQQQRDICSNADYLKKQFGKTTHLFRPSGGAYNNASLRASAACKMKSLVLWDVTVNNGALQYQEGNHLQPGDIVLMHFRKTFAQDLQAFVNAEKAAGLHTQLLENWLLPNNSAHAR